MDAGLAAAAELAAGLPPDSDLVVVRAGTRTILAWEPSAVIRSSGRSAFERLHSLGAGWWAGALSYDLGRDLEPAGTRPGPDFDVPDVLLARFDRRVVFAPDGSAHDARSAAAFRSATRLRRGGGRRSTRSTSPGLRDGTSSLDREDFESRVRALHELIAAGEVYQVNLTRRILWDQPADDVALFRALLETSPAPHAALVRIGGVSVVSASPECFLRWRDGTVVTRPIKGTGVDPAALAANPKERAENTMIVDLARSDLSRICAPGSIEVAHLCEPEEHPGLVHLVSTVDGAFGPEVELVDVLRATLPPASVTGAPKPRALQVIDDFEPVRRGYYCGALGWMDTRRGTGDLSVAIRTFTIAHGRTALGVGSGIVADSHPAREWEETELKAARLLAAAARPTSRARPTTTVEDPAR